MRIITGGGNITRTRSESTRHERRVHLQNKHTERREKLDIRLLMNVSLKQKLPVEKNCREQTCISLFFSNVIYILVI